MAMTSENLKQAFAGESQANRKYLSFAEKAKAEGFAQVARLFTAASEAEAIHARTHLRALEAVKSTVENLEAAVAGETYEFKEMYPPMLRAAVEEGNQRAKTAFDYAAQAEERHATLYAQALEAVRAGKDLAASAVSLCPVCGNVVLGAAQGKCEICGTAAERFITVT